MKKIMTLALVAATMSFAACGGKTGASTADPDSLAFEQTTDATPAEQAQAVVALLQEQLKNADPEQVKAISEQVAQQVAEFVAAGDEEAATAYTAVINNYVAENAEALQQSGAAAAVSSAITTVENIPANIVESTTSAVQGVKNAALVSAINALAAGENVADGVEAATNDAANAAATDAATKAAAANATVEAAKSAVEAAPAAAKAQVKAQAEAAKAAAKAQTEAAAAAAQQQAQSAAAAAQQKAQEQTNKAIDDAAAAAKKKLGL